MIRAHAVRALPVLLALAAAIGVLLLTLALVPVRAEIADFLPAGRTEAARLMLRELRAGPAATLLLAGIEGAPEPELARVSRDFAERLGRTGLFEGVVGGEAGVPEAEVEALVARRYLLSPGTRPEAFEVPALRTGLEGVLRGLRSAASPMVARYGLADPTGALLALVGDLTGGSTVRVVDGAWFAAGQERALLLARGRTGLPPGRLVAAAEAAFQEVSPGPARLLLTGPPVFARDAERSIKADVHTLSLVSTLLVTGLLVWRFRSPLVIAAIAVPVVLSTAAAIAVVGAFFGAVHGLAMGFGLTMLGVSVDYPVLLIGHRKHGEPAAATRARIGTAFRLAVATAALGLAGLIGVGIPGVVQLGLFATVGLLAAAAATWWLLPRLVVAAGLAPVAAGDPHWLARVEGWRRWRALAVLPVLAAASVLLLRGATWEGDLNALSPVPPASLALERELRGALGAAQPGQFLLVTGESAEAVLRQQEVLAPRLEVLREAGVVGGFDLAARLLPSTATQRARQAALPAPEILAARLAEASAGLPFRPAALEPFRDAVAASRSLEPWTPADLAGTALGARLEPLLGVRDGVWQGPVLFRGVQDPTRLATAWADVPGTTYVDVRAELDTLLAGYRGRAGWGLVAGGVLALGLLAAGLRRPVRVLRVAGSVLAALLVTVALLSLGGARLSPIHLIALQLVAGLGLDYALFFARENLDEEERARTLRTLTTCNGMTLLTFGLLATSGTPLLHDIGITVAIGAFSALVFAFLFAGPHPTREATAWTR